MRVWMDIKLESCDLKWCKIIIPCELCTGCSLISWTQRIDMRCNDWYLYQESWLGEQLGGPHASYHGWARNKRRNFTFSVESYSVGPTGQTGTKLSLKAEHVLITPILILYIIIQTWGQASLGWNLELKNSNLDINNLPLSTDLCLFY